MFGTRTPKFLMRTWTPNDIEQENWRRRMADMPTVGETFDMVREIVHSVAAMVGTTLARVESINVSAQALIQQNAMMKAQICDLTEEAVSLNNRLAHMEDILMEGQRE